MSLSTPDLLLSLPTTFGALFIAGNLAAVLFGLSNVQAFIYFQTHGGTGITSFKLVIICLWILDALHLALIIHSVYYYLVTDFANVTILTEIIWSFKLQILLDVLIIYVVHLQYSYRIWIVSKGRSRVLPIIVGIIVILELGVDIGENLTVLYLLAHHFSPMTAMLWGIYRCHVFLDLSGIVWMTFMTLGAITFVDFVIASSLCYLLATSRTGFTSTDSFLTKLIVYTISTGCLTSVTSVAGIITCAAMPKNFIFIGVEFWIAKLYVNSFLALLNARYYLQPSKDTNNPSKYHIRRNLYRPELHVDESQDENFGGSPINLKHPDEEALRPTRPVQAVMSRRPIEMMIEMNSFTPV